MKQGRTLSELAAEVERQKGSRRDFVADTRKLYLVPRPDDSAGMRIGVGEEQFGVTETAHGQIAQALKIPKKYYDRMLDEAPSLLATNVNTWFEQQPQERMVRTLDGNARALLSNRYRPIDNDVVLEAVLPVIADSLQGAQIAACEVTERRLYVKVFLPWVTAEVRTSLLTRRQGEGAHAARNDIVEAGFMLSNSEIGFGAVKLYPMVKRLVCVNALVVEEGGLRGVHLGGRKESGQDGLQELWQEDTQRADLEALRLKLRDTCLALASKERFAVIVERFEAAAERRIEGDPAKAVVELQNQLSLTDEERGGVLRHLIEGGDLSQWGLCNAVTRTSADVESFDRATELEAYGNRVIELPRQQWQQIAMAA